jgi:hypothetical protein
MAGTAQRLRVLPYNCDTFRGDLLTLFAHGVGIGVVFRHAIT